MNEINKRTLDQHIAGPGYHRAETAFKCLGCGNEWAAPVEVEYGIATLINENDALCPDCGAEGKNV